jgi:hypothetical protein
MGIWTEVKGEITVLKESKLSVEKATRTFFGFYDVCYQPFTQDFNSRVRVVRVSFRFESDGIDACNYVNSYVHMLKEKEKYANIDLEVTTRFLA